MPLQQAADIRVIMMGGTIDAEEYDETPAKVKTLPESLIPGLIQRLGYKQRCDCHQWESMKDSQDFTRDDMRKLADFIRADEHDHVIITHGTDAMVRNAQWLDEYLQGSGKTVFFVGAMQPLTHGDRSDGPANMRRAIETIHEIGKEEKGISIIGLGELAGGKRGPCRFQLDDVEKDKEQKLFFRPSRRKLLSERPSTELQR